MAQEIMTSAGTDAYVPEVDIVTPSTSRVLFWRPRFLEESEFLTQVPFLFWIMDNLKPSSLVEIGVGDGVAYFAACQAIDKLGLEARAYGIVLGSDREIPEKLQVYNDNNFADFSVLSTQDPARAARSFPEGAIDLLHINFQLGEASFEAHLQSWLSRISPRGVILFHGVNAVLQSDRLDPFLSQLMEKHPWFHLEVGQGMLLLFYGSRPQDRLLKLAGMEVGAPGYGAVHQVFNRLGSSLQAEYSAKAEAAKAKENWRKLRETEKILEGVREEAEERDKALGKLNEAYDERTRQVALAQGKFFDIQESSAALEMENARLSKQLAGLDDELIRAKKKRDQARRKAKAALKKARKRFEALQAEHDSQLAEKEAALGALSQEYESASAEIARLQDERESLSEQITRLETAFLEANEQIAQAQSQHAELIGDRDRALHSLEELEQTSRNDLQTLTARLEALSARLAEAEIKDPDQIDGETAGALRQDFENGSDTALLDRLVHDRTEDLELFTRLLEEKQIATDHLVAAVEEKAMADMAEKLAQQESRHMQEVERLKAERDAAARHAAELEHALNRLLHSKSWKLTAPVRKMLNAIRGGQS